ncbi:hypothetical protein JTB14_023891 [Gonioctena quinquepunctata]|nr:hypothetical protein JTB14_023891 [Gonioctena quinquepunctata]
MSINKFGHAYSSVGDGGQECDVDLIISYTTDGNIDATNLKICHVKPPTDAEDVVNILYLTQMIDRMKTDFKQATNELLQGWRKDINTNKGNIELLVHSEESLEYEVNSLDDELQTSIERFYDDVNSLKNQYKGCIDHTDERIKSIEINVISLKDEFKDIIELFYGRIVPLETSGIGTTSNMKSLVHSISEFESQIGKINVELQKLRKLKRSHMIWNVFEWAIFIYLMNGILTNNFIVGEEASQMTMDFGDVMKITS